MPIKRREPKKDDDINIKKTFLLLEELSRKNRDIDWTIWLTVFMSLITQSHYHSGATFEEYKVMMNEYIDSFKDEWDKKSQKEG